jgi:transcription antitermination factor NusG
MPFWCARFEPRREVVGQRFLELNGYSVYVPRLRERRNRAGRRVDVITPLFPCYGFVVAQPQWHRARWSIGVVMLIMDGEHPATLGDEVVEALRRREVGGAIELAKPRGLRSRDRVRVTRGLMIGQVGIYAGMRPRERVEVLLTLLGTLRPVVLARGDVEAVG